jgi:hypothetical protein
LNPRKKKPSTSNNNYLTNSLSYNCPCSRVQYIQINKIPCSEVFHQVDSAFGQFLIRGNPQACETAESIKCRVCIPSRSTWQCENQNTLSSTTC